MENVAALAEAASENIDNFQLRPAEMVETVCNLDPPRSAAGGTHAMSFATSRGTSAVLSHWNGHS